MALCVDRNVMKRIFSLAICLLLTGCNSTEQSIAKDLEASVLVKASYSASGKTYQCSTKELQPELVSWVTSFSDPKLASYPTTSQSLKLVFSNGSNYDLQVFTKQGFNYSLVTLPKLRVGKALSLGAICNT